MPSNLPPGVTARMIDELACLDGPCPCCGRAVEECACPECPECEAVGDPRCYASGALRYTKAQRLGQARMRIAQMEERIQDEHQYIAWLEEQPDDWLDEKGAE